MEKSLLSQKKIDEFWDILWYLNFFPKKQSSCAHNPSVFIFRFNNDITVLASEFTIELQITENKGGIK